MYYLGTVTMKVNDIISEAPAGLFKQGLKRLGAAALGAVGAKNAAGKLSASADVGAKANAYSKEFDKFMAKKGLSAQNADYKDLNSFIVTMGLKRPNIPKAGPIEATNLDSLFMAIAKATGSSAPADSGAAPASTGTAPATPGATAAPAAGTTTANQPAPAGTTPAKPKVGAGSGNVPGGSAAPAGPGGKPDPYNDVKSQMRQLQVTGTKVLPDKFVNALAGDIAKLAKGDKDSGTYAADKILKFAQAGYDVAKLAQQWNGSAKAGERFLTQSVYREITAMLAEHGLRWADLGLRVRIVEGIEDGVFISLKPTANSLDFVF